MILAGQCTDPAGRQVATALLEVVAPTTQLRREVPEHRLEGLLERCRGLKPMLTGVVHPCSAEALAGVVAAAEAKLIVPVLFGPRGNSVRSPPPQSSTLPAAASWRPRVRRSRRSRQRWPPALVRYRRS